MNVEETITGSATSASSVSATITAAAETLLVAFVGWKKASRTAALAGWTRVSSGGAPSGFGYGLWWKYNETAGDVTATVQFSDFAGSATVDEAFLYLSEISGATKIDDSLLRTDTADSTVSTAVAISREGNLALHYAVVEAGSLSGVTAPSGHTLIADDDGTGWCLYGYWIAAPYATLYAVTSTLSTPLDWAAIGAECDIDITQSAMLGQVF